jgi:hypothetical protein
MVYMSGSDIHSRCSLAGHGLAEVTLSHMLQEMPHALHLCMLLPGMLLEWLTDTITTVSSNHNECCGKAISAYFTSKIQVDTPRVQLPR